MLNHVVTTNVQTVIATPAERWVLFQMLFQNGDGRRPILRFANGAEGRTFRAFMAALGLVPIQRTVTRFRRVHLDTANDHTFRYFTLPHDCVVLYRQKIADLPRTAAQEAAVGEFLDSLHCVGPGPIGRPMTVTSAIPPWVEGDESWTPEVLVPSHILADLRISGSAVQGAMARLEAELGEKGADLPPDVLKALTRFQDDVLAAIAAAAPKEEKQEQEEEEEHDDAGDEPEPDLEPATDEPPAAA